MKIAVYSFPYNTFHKIYPGAYENQIRFQAYPNMLDQAVDQATEVLRRRRNVATNAKDNFVIRTAQQEVEQFHSIVGMVAIAAVVLSCGRTADRRCRRDEYHAGQRDRAHPRNRHPQSHRRQK